MFRLINRYEIATFFNVLMLNGIHASEARSFAEQSTDLFQ